MRIYLAQIRPYFSNLRKNFDKSIKILNKIENGIIIFPELFLTGYNFNSKEEILSCALPKENEYFEKYKEFSLKKDIAICGGYAEIEGEKIYNSAFFIANGKLIENYRKTHLFNREKLFFEKGNTGFNVFNYKGVNIGIMICFDWYFPEAARTLALKKAQVILHPSNLVLPYCQKAIFTRALENKVFIATVNRVGIEKNKKNGIKLHFKGNSVLVSPDGKYLLKLSKFFEKIKSYNIDPDESLNKNITKLNNFLEDRRKELYFL
jgi:predicted amidohydrolase